jgi:predicted dehydrogenase
MPTLAAVDEVLALARQRGLRVMVNNQYYQMPIFRRVQQAIDGWETGRLFHIHAWQQMFVPPEAESGWKAALQPRRALFEFGTHAIDLICRYFGGYPQAVTAQIARPRPDSANDTCITARLDFPHHRLATLTLNRLSRAPIRYFEMRLDGEQLSLRTSLGGLARFDAGWNSERGRPRLRFSLTQGGEVRAERDGRSHLLARQPAGAFGTATAAHLAAFVAAVQGNREPEPPAAHARAVLAATLACYESAESDGRLISLAETVA